MEIVDTITSILNEKKSRKVWTIGPDGTVFEAIEMMSSRNVGALPVVRDDQLVGIVSERDYTRKVILKGRSSRETPVSAIMTGEVITVVPSMKVVSCLQLMTDRSVRHLPVMVDGRLAGIVSIGDLVRHIISAQGALISQLRDYVIGSYPG
jgi:CBS domain-containing protein